MSFEGGPVQNAIFVSGESPGPVAAEDWEARAAEVLEPGQFDYIAGGAGSEATMRANLEAFERRADDPVECRVALHRGGRGSRRRRDAMVPALLGRTTARWR